MPSLKSIRKRILSVKSTQKITRAMKMVAGARLSRAQQRIQALRPYAVKTQDVLGAVAGQSGQAGAGGADGAGPDIVEAEELHPLLVRRPEGRVAVLLFTADRGLCGAYNANANKAAERLWREYTAAGKEVEFFIVGRKGRDYLKRRGAPIAHAFTGIWEKIGFSQARFIADTILAPFRASKYDAIHVIFTQFRSAMVQTVTTQRLLPVADLKTSSPSASTALTVSTGHGASEGTLDYVFEPDRKAILDRLVPLYIEITILRALYESQASEFGARMTAMDSATKNAKKRIEDLTLVYNRTRQAAITKELMEIIGGAEAMKE